jgi:putative flippase GtrA
MRQPARFVIVGLANTLCGLTVIYGAKFFLGLGDVAANALGYGVGLTVSFVLNKNWTFGYEGPVTAAVVRYLVVFLIAYAINLAVVVALIDQWAINGYLAQALGVVPYTVSFFLMAKYFAFRLAASAR